MNYVIANTNYSPMIYVGDDSYSNFCFVYSISDAAKFCCIEDASYYIKKFSLHCSWKVLTQNDLMVMDVIK